MRRFSFRLEKLLRLRNHLERAQQIETQQREQVVVELEGSKRILEEERTETIQDLSPGRGKRWKGLEQREKVEYLGRVEHLLVATQGRLSEENENLEKAREKLVEASRGRKVVESLRNRQWKEWQEEFLREEGKELDEIGQTMVRRNKEKGSTIVTLLLLVIVMGLGFLCFSTWNNWLKTGDVGYPILRAPFDRLAQDRVRKELMTFQNDQRVRRQKLERLLLEAKNENADIVVEAGGREGFKRTLERIRQKEEELSRKEEEIRSKKAAVEQSQKELTAEIRRNNNLLNRISSTLAELQTLEEKRNREISEDRKERIKSLSEMIRKQKPADAATLLLAVAFPDPLNPLAPPFPPDESFEGPDLVMAVLLQVPSVDRAEIMNKMVRVSAEKSAVLFDMMDNPRTGLEPDKATAKP